MKTDVLEIQVTNSDNPFDDRGLAHNVMLEKFIKDVVLPFDSNNRSGDVDVFAIVFDYFDIEEEGREIISTFHGSSHKNISDFNEAELELNFNSVDEYDFYLSIKDVVENTDLVLQDKITSIIQIEKEIADSDLTSNNKEILLTATSIGRYSLYFWAPESMGGLGYHDELDIDPRSVDWWGVGRTDIYGAALAGFTTANPLVALGWGAASSALDALDESLT